MFERNCVYSFHNLRSWYSHLGRNVDITRSHTQLVNFLFTKHTTIIKIFDIPEPWRVWFWPVMITSCNINCFNFVWPVPTNRNETTWLANWLPPLTCYCADQSRLVQSLSFVKCGRLLLCFMECSSPSIVYSFMLPKGVRSFIKIGHMCLLCFICIDDSS
jgi:hypothetical protein